MSKKNFKPEVVSVEFVSSPLMLIVSVETGGVGTGGGTAGDEHPDLAGKNRGEWGNMWK